MKKNTLFFSICLLLSLTLKAQAPQGFNYQAVARNNSGVAIANQSIGLKIDILQGTSTGTIVYSETHSATSNSLGLINLIVGGGTIVSGTFNSIDWSAGPYFVEISMDVTGGTTYVLMGTQQLMSVPYALYAANSGTAGPQGLTGSTGNVGSAGIAGSTGGTGSIGATGATASTGTTGTIGNTGSTGMNGSTGSGNTGATGTTGDRYSTTSATSMPISPVSTPISFTVDAGLAYSLGQEVIIAFSSTEQMVGTITSYTSGTGVMNVTVSSATGTGTSLQPWAVNLKGAPGPAGPAGSIGVTGTTGAANSTGSTGNTGSNGLVGITGSTGTAGSNGSTGSTGSNGMIGLTGSTGSTGIAGLIGDTGSTGRTGSTGGTGSNGLAGSTGATGADATFAVQFNIVNTGSGYFFDNASDYNSGSNLNPNITLYRGFTYKFNVNASGHPFIIATGTTGTTAYTVGVTNNTVQVGVLTFKVPQDAPSTLHYICQFHSGMTGTITIL